MNISVKAILEDDYCYFSKTNDVSSTIYGEYPNLKGPSDSECCLEHDRPQGFDLQTTKPQECGSPSLGICLDQYLYFISGDKQEGDYGQSPH